MGDALQTRSPRWQSWHKRLAFYRLLKLRWWFFDVVFSSFGVFGGYKIVFFFNFKSEINLFSGSVKSVRAQRNKVNFSKKKNRRLYVAWISTKLRHCIVRRRAFKTLRGRYGDNFQASPEWLFRYILTMTERHRWWKGRISHVSRRFNGSLWNERSSWTLSKWKIITGSWWCVKGSLKLLSEKRIIKLSARIEKTFSWRSCAAASQSEVAQSHKSEPEKSQLTS